MIPSTLQSETVRMGEVKGSKLSTIPLLPDFAAISIGVLPPCYVTKEQKVIPYIGNILNKRNHITQQVRILRQIKCFLKPSTKRGK
jgi:hypothetical protein